jgi:hypothetical protein
MSFGEKVFEILTDRGIGSRLRYAEIQALKAVEDADGMRAFLAERGGGVEEERIDPLHFADAIELEVLRARLTTEATAIALLFGLS